MGTNGSIKALMTHCCREALHAQWSILLDDEFVEAYQHGIVIKCCDGITRRFYPRILAYSADYPEKYAIYLRYLCLYLIFAQGSSRQYTQQRAAPMPSLPHSYVAHAEPWHATRH
jgi:Plavaka transposase